MDRWALCFGCLDYGGGGREQPITVLLAVVIDAEKGVASWLHCKQIVQ